MQNAMAMQKLDAACNLREDLQGTALVDWFVAMRLDVRVEVSGVAVFQEKQEFLVGDFPKRFVEADKKGTTRQAPVELDFGEASLSTTS